MTVMTEALVDQVDHDATTLDVSSIASYLQDTLGQRIAAYLVGLRDSRQVGRWIRGEHTPTSGGQYDRRLREGYKVVRMLVEAYDAQTAKAWLFGTNSRLDDHAPIEVLAAAETTEDFRQVRCAARQFASVDW